MSDNGRPLTARELLDRPKKLSEQYHQAWRAGTLQEAQRPVRGADGKLRLRFDELVVTHSVGRAGEPPQLVFGFLTHGLRAFEFSVELPAPGAEPHVFFGEAGWTVEMPVDVG